ncbi:G-type lectin S-receptor-like serine/threonine-protein kinase RKS1 [Capsicum annuum]|uniref:G-type lectin S-receptor-like serine/threonine-protein kinase At1g11410 isoform X2 n=1 Tax=Capsicum annuum TaxID=4072 RepID=UPI0007BFC183|nr:G-type lectin S-receptor-like serine/threonine-protein kinase At1g11410 isoform X2 [Capsicum annuum]KAF3666781.1 G-type lectin S-receptor-like serine/threonine-protein kinase RKS1 [Capsicum annuum]KAF3674097.1 G-type lectin S-receptor-like serine/threonine-protein kinase RKS1 [Capsicum annuum]
MCQKKESLIVFVSFLVPFCTSIDTISFNQSLKDGDLLISSGKSFVLGFFGNSPGKRYLGIWYKNVPEQTVVWVANRDNPVNGTSGILTIDSTGNLVLLDAKTKVSAWRTNASSARKRADSYTAKLRDSGNLVLFQDSKMDVIKWQSFDYPTNTLLPSMKYGIDKRTGLNRFLTSWKSLNDPGMGEYRYTMELNGTPQVFLYKNSSRIWRTGSWTGHGWSGVPEMSQRFIFNLSYVDNDTEVSLTYGIRDASIISRMVLNESGFLNRLTWQESEQKWVQFWSAPKDPCDNYEHCGAFSNCNLFNLVEFECSCLPGYKPKLSRQWYLRDGSHGCMRKKDKKVCNKGEGFFTLSHVKIPDTGAAQMNKSMGFKECEELCLKNCSCTAYASANISAGESGCITWYGELRDIKQYANGAQDFYVRVSASDLAQRSKNSNSHNRKRMIVILVGSAAAIILAISSAYCVVINQKRNDRNRSNSLASYAGMVENKPAEISIFDLSTITDATDNFSDANKLGEGGFGRVYRGHLTDGQVIAVKRLSVTSGQGTEEFKNEVTLIARLQHRNLVRLLGCCVQRGEKMLVYEYMPNKSLDRFIFDKTEGSLLDWGKRFEIIHGIARGVLYLHQDSRLRIIHRDLKASNILLDASMQPKISDFGMARIFGGNQSEANTNRVVGTYGYMSPEYAMVGHFSTKSDVFSFGVLCLEIITGRKNSSHNDQEKSQHVVGYVWDSWKDEKALDVVDPLLRDSYEACEVLRCIHISLLCVQPFTNDRPTMSEVVFMLCNETNLPSPKQPNLIFRSENQNSVNEMSTSTLYGRYQYLF